MGRSAFRVVLGLGLISLIIGSSTRARAMINGELVQSQQGAELSIVGLQLLDQFDKILSPCAGVMLRADAILTAGHCIDFAIVQSLVSIRVTRSLDLNVVMKNDAMTQDVRRVYPHPRYNSQRYYKDKKLVPTYDNDLAVIFLNGSLPGPVPAIRFARAAEMLAAGTRLGIYGYGVSDESKKPGDPGYGRRLQRGLFVLDSKESYGRRMTMKNGPTSLCYGDSGGPGFLLDSDLRPLPILATISSATNRRSVQVKGRWIQTCVGEAILQPIASYVPWIESVLAREAVRP